MSDDDAYATRQPKGVHKWKLNEKNIIIIEMNIKKSFSVSLVGSKTCKYVNIFIAEYVK